MLKLCHKIQEWAHFGVVRAPVGIRFIDWRHRNELQAGRLVKTPHRLSQVGQSGAEIRT
jgi:hypothetical protein